MDDDQLRRHRLDNIIQSLALLMGMTGVLAVLGWTLSGPNGLVWAIGLGLVALVLGQTISPAMVLRMYRARPLSARMLPDLHLIVDELARRACIPTPNLYYVPSRLLNGFAVGNRSRSAIAMTDGLLRSLNLRELAGVLAHEVAHIRHNDIWVMGLADVVSRVTTVLSQIGLLLVIVLLPLALFGLVQFSLLGLAVLIAAPFVNNLLQLALSRTREYDADLGAAELTGDPQGLASALEKLERYQGGWIESILLPGRRIPDPATLRTHPPTRERIHRLLSLAPNRPLGQPLRPPLRPDRGATMASFPAITRHPRWHLNGLWH